MKEGVSGEWPAGQLPASLRLFFLDLMHFFCCCPLVRDLPTQKKQFPVIDFPSFRMETV